MYSLVSLIIFALNVYLWIIMASVIVSWLVAFDVLNTRNDWVRKLVDILNRATQPVFAKVRGMIPPLGGVDISPMIVIFGIMILQRLLVSIAFY